MTAPVVLLGPLDTKAAEYGFLRERLTALGVPTLLVDAGTGGPPRIAPDLSLRLGAVPPTRGESIARMAAEAAIAVRRLYDEGDCSGVLAAGGSGTTSIAAAAMQALPIGVPKLIVSTVASGDTRGYVGTADIALLASVTDVAGVNALSARILGNAAAAMAGMVLTAPVELPGGRPLAGATMFGVTTPCVDAARAELERRGYEVIVFHANGTGGRALEGLLASGFLEGVLDVTTTELADELVGGALPAGPERVETAGRLGLAQVVSVGALDMVNFGPLAEVPERFRARRLHAHNPHVTLMRTTPEECAQLGGILARKLAAARGPAALFVPLGGVSALSVKGAPFHDPAADAALFDALRAELDGTAVELHTSLTPINDPAFAAAMARRLDEFLR
jgi:uncharacterized protein (UPF0261 family)